MSVTADLTIEPGVEVTMAENTGISFDGGLQADGTCAKFTAVGTAADRITFNADRSVNSNALWHGLAFTDDCGGSAEDDRHTFDKVDSVTQTTPPLLLEVGLLIQTVHHVVPPLKTVTLVSLQ